MMMAVADAALGAAPTAAISVAGYRPWPALAAGSVYATVYVYVRMRVLRAVSSA